MEHSCSDTVTSARQRSSNQQVQKRGPGSVRFQSGPGSPRAFLETLARVPFWRRSKEPREREPGFVGFQDGPGIPGSRKHFPEVPTTNVSGNADERFQECGQAFPGMRTSVDPAASPGPRERVRKYFSRLSLSLSLSLPLSLATSKRCFSRRRRSAIPGLSAPAPPPPPPFPPVYPCPSICVFGEVGKTNLPAALCPSPQTCLSLCLSLPVPLQTQRARGWLGW